MKTSHIVVVPGGKFSLRPLCPHSGSDKTLLKDTVAVTQQVIFLTRKVGCLISAWFIHVCDLCQEARGS